MRTLTLGLALALGAVALPAGPAAAQQVYSFADIMAALTVRLPTGQTVTAVPPDTLQGVVRSLTLEQATRVPANVSRIAGVVSQVRHDAATVQAIQAGIADALEFLVAAGQIAPLARDLMMEQTATALGSDRGPAGPAPVATPTPTLPPPASPTPLPPPDPPVISAPQSWVPSSPTAMDTPNPLAPRAAPIPPVTTATLPTVAAPAPLNPGAPPYATAPWATGAALRSDDTALPALPVPTAVAAPSESDAPPYAGMVGPDTGIFPDTSAGRTWAPSPWVGQDPGPETAGFPARTSPRTLMDLPREAIAIEVTAPPATLAESGH